MNLHKQLALMLANLRKKRPYYCEVEYLHSDGNQYIDTEFCIDPNKVMSFEGYMMWTSSHGTENFFFGYRSTSSATITGDMRAFFIYGASPEGRVAIRYGVNADNSTQSVFQLNKKVKVSFDGTNLKVNDTTCASVSSSYQPATNKNMWLFNCNAEGYYSSDISHFIGHIYKYKICNDGVPAVDLIPVLDWNMTPCMYDRVSGKFFYNKGTGNFTYGREIHYVDYLESTGTQYINTGLLSTASSKVDTTFSFTSMESGSKNNCAIFGGRTNTTMSTFTLFKLASTNPQKFRFDYNNQTDVGNANNMTWDTTSKYRFTYNGTTIKIENITTGEYDSTNKSPASTFTTAPITLFAVNTNGGVSQYMSGRMYNYWNTDGVNTVDMYPAIDENGVGFMFDKEGHKIFDNAGTGAFKYPARELEYLQSSGTQYIDTGLKGKNGYDFEYKVNFTQVGTNAYAVGGLYESQKSCYMGMIRTNSKLSYHYQDTSSPIEVQTVSANTDYTVKAHMYSGEQYFEVNGVRSSSGTKSGDFESTNTMWLFGLNSFSPLYSYLKMPYCKIKYNDALVRDFIPCFKDGVSGMYDKENNVMYPNAGTGTFGVGKIVEPEYEQ